MRIAVLIGFIFITAFTVPVSAQNPAERGVLELRAKIREAVKARDKVRLGEYFADGFKHTHASGKVDDKAARIEFFLRGEPSIEDVAPDEQKFEFFGRDVVVLTARTTVDYGTEKRIFQWTGVYVRLKGRWRVAATHATLVKPS